MKFSTKILKSITFLLLLISQRSIAQTTDWRQMSNNKNVTFYQVQQDFTNYWQGKTPKKGQGYGNFRRWADYMAPRVYPTGNMNLPSKTYPNFIEWENKYNSNNSPQ